MSLFDMPQTVLDTEHRPSQGRITKQGASLSPRLARTAETPIFPLNQSMCNLEIKLIYT